MAKYTTNYNLVKPELTDAPPDITVMNQNWDKIDDELHKLADKDVDVTPEGIGAVPNIKNEKNLSTPGWYRIGTFTDRTSSHLQVFIGGSFNMTNPTPFVVDVYHRFNGGQIQQRPAIMDATAVTKVRMVTIGDYTYAVDIYYNLSSENAVMIRTQPNGVLSYTNSELESVLETSGTVLSTIDLTKDGFLEDYLPLTGGTIITNNSYTNLGTKQVRNISAGTTDLTAGTSSLATGDIHLVYE